MTRTLGITAARAATLLILVWLVLAGAAVAFAQAGCDPSLDAECKPALSPEATIQAIAVAIGLAIPLVVSFVKAQHWSNTAKRVLFIGTAVVATVGERLALDGSAALHDWRLWVVNFGTIVVSAQAFYHGLWKDTAPERALSRVKVLGNKSAHRAAVLADHV